MNSTNILIGLALVVAAGLGNVVLLVFIILPYRKVAQMRSWEQVMGRVEGAEIVMHSDSEGGSSPYPHVTYTYSVNGQSLTNDRIQPGGDVGGMVAYKTLKRYTVGMQLPVYYNPQNPAESLLERNVPGYVRWLWVALVFLNATICCCGILPTFGFQFMGMGMKQGLPYLFQFIAEQMKP